MSLILKEIPDVSERAKVEIKVSWDYQVHKIQLK